MAFLILFHLDNDDRIISAIIGCKKCYIQFMKLFGRIRQRKKITTVLKVNK